MIRNEYPRPQFVRKDWINLNGEWDFTYDDENKGLKEKWYLSDKLFDKKIEVPYVYQSKLSGINDQGNHETVWYKKEFTLPDGYKEKELILHFGAVDYYAEVFINGHKAGEHKGGHTSFSLDITPYITGNEEIIVIRVHDPRTNEMIPRGKQIWEEKPLGIWYTNTTGIWQSVWIEPVNENHIQSIYFTPDIDSGQVQVKTYLNGTVENKKIEYTVSFKEKTIIKTTFDLYSSIHTASFDIHQKTIFRTSHHHNGWHWTPETPNLFDVEIKLLENENILDNVKSYFGMRKIHTENGLVYLNNKPYYQKLVLDQGYWPESLMTAPSDNALKYDIEISKEMGFNGCRKHQKVEDPRFLYWADKLGFLVWGESASAQFFDESSVPLATNEWLEIIKRDYNHPSIVTWVPFNESWGVNDIGRDKQQQHYSLGLYHLIHSLDTTRPVISNDGWEMTRSDIGAVHHYGHGEAEEREKYEKFKFDIRTLDAILDSKSANRSIYASGFSHQGEPILLTEFGGIGYKKGEQEGWGYSSVDNEEQFLSEYKRVIEAVYDSEVIAGFCYTQLYDVEQEINGLLTYDRNPKADVSKVKEINNSPHFKFKKG